jgi:hypothetical protein
LSQAAVEQVEILPLMILVVAVAAAQDLLDISQAKL